jgi:hypothetical protein
LLAFVKIGVGPIDHIASKTEFFKSMHQLSVANFVKSLTTFNLKV